MFRPLSCDLGSRARWRAADAWRVRVSLISAGLAILCLPGLASGQDPGAARPLQLPPDLPEVHLQTLKDRRRATGSHQGEAQKHVLGADGVVAQALGLPAGEA